MENGFAVDVTNSAGRLAPPSVASDQRRRTPIQARKEWSERRRPDSAHEHLLRNWSVDATDHLITIPLPCCSPHVLLSHLVQFQVPANHTVFCILKLFVLPHQDGLTSASAPLTRCVVEVRLVAVHVVQGGPIHAIERAIAYLRRLDVVVWLSLINQSHPQSCKVLHVPPHLAFILPIVRAARHKHFWATCLFSPASRKHNHCCRRVAHVG
mmetsp:Transcript_20355/g.54410  ORF Transcript_20355/g.54410 Transcript_20355/m.54410 type:complete len:211 (-) Transcript_20355:902-1534(-)